MAKCKLEYPEDTPRPRTCPVHGMQPCPPLPSAGRPGKAQGDMLALTPDETPTKANYGDTCPCLKLAKAWGIDYGYVLIGVDHYVHTGRRINRRIPVETIPRDWGAGLRGSEKDRFLNELVGVATRYRQLQQGAA